MILEKKKLLFRTVFLVFEEDKAEEIIKSGKYASIVLISRKDLPLGLSRREKKTAIIDLHQNENDIFAKFNDTTRNEIRKTMDTDDLKIISGDTNKKEVYNLYKQFEYGQGRVPFPESDMNDCTIFSAYYKSELISAIYVDKGGNDLRVRYIFSKRLESDKDLYKTISNSTRRLVLEICLWGKSNNFKFLDMATVNFDNPNVAGITKFKMSFGGDVVLEYSYIYRSKTFILFEKIAILKNYLKKLFKI